MTLAYRDDELTWIDLAQACRMLQIDSHEEMLEVAALAGVPARGEVRGWRFYLSKPHVADLIGFKGRCGWTQSRDRAYRLTEDEAVDRVRPGSVRPRTGVSAVTALKAAALGKVRGWAIRGRLALSVDDLEAMRASDAHAERRRREAADRRAGKRDLHMEAIKRAAAERKAKRLAAIA